MKRLLVLTVVLLATGCTNSEPGHLVIYSGRSKALVEPLILKYQETTGRSVDVRYGDTAQLAVALTEEGSRSSADLFWAQDAGALGAVAAAGLLRQLPDSLLARTRAAYRGSDGRWVATSGRARTLAFSTDRVGSEELPQSVLDLTAPVYRERVGWAPANGSFQAFVTALRLSIGEEPTRDWLIGMKANGAKAYSRNTAILQGIANGEIDFGLPNHYYLHRFLADDPDFPVDQTTFRPGDAGNLINVAGIGILSSGSKQDAALALVSFILSPESQAYFRSETFEYPVVLEGAEGEVGVDTLRPDIVLDDLRDLERTLDLLRETGLL